MTKFVIGPEFETGLSDLETGYMILKTGPPHFEKGVQDFGTRLPEIETGPTNFVTRQYEFNNLKQD